VSHPQPRAPGRTGVTHWTGGQPMALALAQA
jgi:hypothetical protein